ncbi:cupin domain-containing protein [Halobacillus sp. Marseille-P3879]|uniref:cupin domain-containing protein n=1 Tax=Halobacillus sp. Marseille-P3879 TaxID=2045014 RepID=UPI000C7BBDFF|nr:cupin domain-containing protein [Halobacillus sp. Marseille-P3879]
MEQNDFMKSKEVQQFDEDIKQHHLGPLWHAIPQLASKEPNKTVKPYLWKWKLIKEKLEDATEIFTPERGGERRAIYLQNPGLENREPYGWGSTTSTMYVAVQLILPGETAPSHRHTQSALRFIKEGDGAFSIVDGERLFMEEGDFLSTPKGRWHGHSQPGDKPMFWIDVLDIPTIYFLNGSFFEGHPDGIENPSLPDNYSARKYAGGQVRPPQDRHSEHTPLGAYKWEQTKKALDSISDFEPDPYDGHSVEYLSPSNGETAHPNISSRLQKLEAGFHSKSHRHTSSTVVHIFKGEGYTVIDNIRYDWEEGDLLVIPNWAWHEHVSTSTGDSYLFTVSDLPMMEKFGLEREEAYQGNNGHQEVKEVFNPELQNI